ncbi:MAG: TIGR03435 family protein [Janthinobacterium lividum]
MKRPLLATTLTAFSVALFATGSCAAHAQVTTMEADPTKTLQFEVATIKLSPAKGEGLRTIRPLAGGNGYMAQNFPVRLMIALMYKVPLRQVEGGPEWLDNEYFDIEARADTTHPKDELQAMFRQLLKERFGLKMRKVTREGNVFALRVEGAASRMQADPAGPGFEIPIKPVGPGTFQGRRVPMPYLSWWLGQQMQIHERPVIDLTGLSAVYDFELAFQPEQPAGADLDRLPSELRDKPSLFSAVRQQLGLKLVAEKGPVEYYIIDQVERPTVD